MAGGDLVTWEQLCEDDDNVLEGGSRAWKKMIMPVCEFLWDFFKVLPKEKVSGLPASNGFIADYLVCIYPFLLTSLMLC